MALISTIPFVSLAKTMQSLDLAKVVSGALAESL
jgi:hypothetical protein